MTFSTAACAAHISLSPFSSVSSSSSWSSSSFSSSVSCSKLCAGVLSLAVEEAEIGGNGSEGSLPGIFWGHGGVPSAPSRFNQCERGYDICLQISLPSVAPRLQLAEGVAERSYVASQQFGILGEESQRHTTAGVGEEKYLLASWRGTH